jgi:hypothetical protein
MALFININLPGLVSDMERKKVGRKEHAFQWD